jgi:Cft2 family RNA processing exonuclease
MTEIYTTTPISKLGFYTIIDAIYSKIEIEDFPFFSEKDTAETFQKLRELNYDQKVKLSHNDNEIIIYPISSGYSLGGSAWIISFNGKNIIYAPQISIDSKK